MGNVILKEGIITIESFPSTPQFFCWNFSNSKDFFRDVFKTIGEKKAAHWTADNIPKELNACMVVLISLVKQRN
jgi:hypothetical protein